ncbi:MAG: cation:proton antiporter [Clostridia bacterium]|nr:cation:proton antiporter [Clostridia bacterium]
MFDGILGLIMAMAIILLSTKVLGLVTRKLGLPQVLGYILAGLLIGPALFGMAGFSLIGFSGDGVASLIKLNFLITEDGSTHTVLDIFSKIGVILIMFSAGLETNLKHLKETGLTATLIALAGVLLPLALGVLASVPFMVNHLLDGAGFVFDNVYQSIYIGVILTATSVAITVSVLKELKVINGKIATTVVSAAIIDDVVGMVILSIVNGLSGAADPAASGFEWFKAQWWGVIILIIAFFIFAIGAGVGVHYLFTWLDKKYPRAERISLFSLVVCFIYAFFAEEIFGIGDITGAYIAGIMLSTCHRTATWTEKNVDVNTFMIFGPMFFAAIGINMSFEGMTGWLILFAVIIVIVGLAGKVIGCGAVEKLRGGSWKEAGIAGFGMMARGEVALIITSKGIETGLLSQSFMVVTVLLILVSSIITPIMLKKLYKNYSPYKTTEGSVFVKQARGK